MTRPKLSLSAVGGTKHGLVKHTLMRIERISGTILAAASGNGQDLHDRIDPGTDVFIRPAGNRNDTITRRIFVFEHGPLGDGAAPRHRRAVQTACRLAAKVLPCCPRSIS